VWSDLSSRPEGRKKMDARVKSMKQREARETSGRRVICESFLMLRKTTVGGKIGNQLATSSERRVKRKFQKS
jgi:hypothetical protein